jgi:hypothetical protein
MRSRLQMIGVTLMGFSLLLAPLMANAARGIQGSPKIIDLFIDWQMTERDVQELAKWDVVVLDYDQQVRYPEKIRELRSLNPAIKILAYIPSEEISDARFSEPPEYPGAVLASDIDSAWYVHDVSGQKAYFWPGSSLLNVTDEGPVGASGKRWNEFLPQFIHDEILSTSLWDGVFLDNTFDGISHFSKTSVDLNRDGVADTTQTEDQAWQAGMKHMLTTLARENPNAIVIGNGGDAYSNQMNGVFFEHFPSWDWAANWKQFRDAIGQDRQPSYTALNVNTNNAPTPGNYQLMRYGLGSALVGGGYYSFDQGDYNHDSTWWYDEYDTSLGVPRSAPRIIAGGKGSAITSAVWARDFQNGLVLVNSTNASQSVPLPGVFERLHGTQDTKQNDGSLVTSITLAPHDGIVLLRRADAAQLRDAAFVNGSFIRTYDSDGRQLQNGFFAQRSDVPSGALTVVSDLDGDGIDDVVFAEKGTVTVRLGNGKTTSIQPFGKKYTGSLSLAVGQTTRFPQKDIVIGRGSGSPPAVRMYSFAGKLLASWNAYGTSLQGGARVAVGSFTSGLRQIVTGAGPGGGPHVRIWKTDGTPWEGDGFFAFDQSEHGGVSVAVGDVDGDGKDKIIVGSGQGAVPRVRIFDAHGTLEREITLGAQPLLGGITVAASDVNGDGRAEILISGLSAF